MQKSFSITFMSMKNIPGEHWYEYGSKGLRKNNFAELAPRFGSDLAAPIEQNHRNSSTI